MMGAVIVAMFAAFSEAPGDSEEQSEVERGLKLGFSLGALPSANGGGSTQSSGFAIGFFAGHRWSRVEVLFSREEGVVDVATGDGRTRRVVVARNLLEVVQLTPIASRCRGNVRPGLYAGISLGIGLESRLSTLFRYHIGVVVGAGVAIGRSSVEVRYRQGVLHYGYVTVPGLDIRARSLTGLVGFRF